jgi:hypothetical protein
MPDGVRSLRALHEQPGRKRRHERFPGEEKAGIQSGIGLKSMRWSDGEMEYWSTGKTAFSHFLFTLLHYSTTPVLQYL